MTLEEKYRKYCKFVLALQTETSPSSNYQK